MIGLIIALISGALMSVQGVFNTQVTKASSIWAANCFVQFSALLVCLAAWAVTDRSSLLGVFQVQPKYMLLGGAIGAFITYTVIKSMDMLGPARAVMLIVVAQLLVAYLIELFGMFGVEKAAWDWRKAIGMVLAIAGIVVFKWESKWASGLDRMPHCLPEFHHPSVEVSAVSVEATSVVVMVFSVYALFSILCTVRVTVWPAL
mgnify:CR=1 FL=1